MLQLTTIIFLISFSTFAVIYSIAVKLFLFWSIPWLDIPMHFFGGVIVALGFFTLRDLRLFPNRYLKLWAVLALVLVVAVVWEIYEFALDMSVWEANYALDTLVDICLGVFGGWCGYILGNNLRKLR